VHTTPDSLLVDPCGAKPAGETVRSLAKAYVDNTTCIHKYQLLLQNQRSHKEKIRVLYDGQPQRQ